LHYLSEILALFSLFHPTQFLTFKNSGTKILNELAEIGMILDAKRFYAFFLSKLYRYGLTEKKITVTFKAIGLLSI